MSRRRPATARMLGSFGARARAVLCAGLGFAALSPQVLAGSFGIAPTRLALDAAHPIAVLTVHNQSDSPALMQARILAWTQSDGEDRFEETRDVLIAPPVFELAPAADQIIRVALRRAPDVGRELSYRVLLQEVPQRPPAMATGLTMALQLSIPVFVQPTQTGAHADVGWVLRRLPAHVLQVEATNSGAAHIQIQRFELIPGDGRAPIPVEVARYLLPGSRTGWSLPEAGTAASGTTLQIRGASDWGDFTAKVAAADP